MKRPFEGLTVDTKCSSQLSLTIRKWLAVSVFVFQTLGQISGAATGIDIGRRWNTRPRVNGIKLDRTLAWSKVNTKSTRWV